MDESVEEGMRREIKEETGLTVQDMHYLFSIPNLYDFSGMTIHTTDMFYRTDVDDSANPVADDDAAELMWIPLCNVNPDDFGLWSIRQAVIRFLELRVKSLAN